VTRLVVADSLQERIMSHMASLLTGAHSASAAAAADAIAGVAEPSVPPAKKRRAGRAGDGAGAAAGAASAGGGGLGGDQRTRQEIADRAALRVEQLNALFGLCDADCCICCEPMLRGNLMRMPCGRHDTCEPCGRDWAAAREGLLSCPLCRATAWFGGSW
jgi:hypothetical protein